MGINACHTILLVLIGHVAIYLSSRPFHFSCGTGEFSNCLRLCIMFDGVQYRPIYNGYMKVSIPMATIPFLSSQPNFRSNPCTTASLALFIGELWNNFPHRSLLFLWWFSLNFQCLHVRSFNVTIPFMLLTFSHKDHRYSEVAFSPFFCYKLSL